MDRRGDVDGGPQFSDLFYSFFFIHQELTVIRKRRPRHIEFLVKIS
jgi:hypothetical protein